VIPQLQALWAVAVLGCEQELPAVWNESMITK